MEIQAFWGRVYEVLAVMATLGFPPVVILYNRALKRQISFSPALAFAYTYFKNFIRPMRGVLISEDALVVGGVRVDKLFISMPRTLVDASEDRIAAIPQKLKPLGASLEEVTVKTASGKRNVFVLHKDGERIAFDVPRIVSSIEHVLTDHLGQSRSVASNRWRKMEEREIRNFCRHIRKIIKHNGYQDSIKVFDCDVPELTSDTDDLEEAESWFRRTASRLRALLARG